VHKRVRSWTIWLQVAVIISVLVGLAIWLFHIERKPLDDETLSILAADLRSQAAVGQLLTEQALSKCIPSTFLHVQASQLSDSAASTLKSVQGSKAAPGKEADVRSIIDLAQRLKSDFEVLAYVEDENRLNQLKTDFSTLTIQIQTLEESHKS
jgi:hypothetical protein